MKKSIFLAALAVVAMVCAGCDSERFTPVHDSTELWPAVSSETGKWGYIDSKGTFVIPANYDVAHGFSCGYALVESGENSFYIDTKGKMQDAPRFEDAEDFYYKYARVEADDLYGMLNTKFKYAIQPTFYDLGRRMGDNGLVAARQTEDGLYGYVNSKGSWKIQPLYEDAEPFHNGVAIIKLGDKEGVINDNGEFIVPPTYDNLMDVGEGMTAYELNKKWGVLDKNGKVLIAPVYDDLGTMVDNGLLPVAQSGKCGYLNSKGDTKINFMYYNADPFFEGYAFVQQSENGVWMCINTKGTIRFALLHNEKAVTGFHNGLALVELYDDEAKQLTARYINVNGETVYSWKEEWSSSYNAPVRQTDNENTRSQQLIEMTLHFDSRNL